MVESGEGNGGNGCMSYLPEGMALATKGEGGTLKLRIVLSGLCYCTISSHIAPITTVTFSSHNRPSQFFSLAIDSAKGRYAAILGRDQLKELG